MNEQIQSALAPLKQFWERTPATVRRVAIAGVIISIISAIGFSLMLNMDNYVVIFDGITERESGEILAQLQTMDVKVKLDANQKIMVPQKDESRVRMELATAGYPKNGLSYYLIEENSGMLTTDYERKQYMNMQLQERIAASIKTLDGVRDAVVTITAPSEQVFYLDEKEQTSASVIIHMSPGIILNKSQISGIQNLVAKAVSGLSIDNIALSDSQGNDLGGSTINNNPGYSKLSITREIEDDIKEKINSVLIGPYNLQQFKTSVTATVDMDELVTEETLYTPSKTGQNSGVISQETNTADSSSNTQADGGVAGTSSNSEVPTYPAGGSEGGSTSTSSSASITYQVSQTKSQSQKYGAKIEAISIGIAVDKTSFEQGERESLIQLISFATGVSAGSISVQNFNFSTEEDQSTVQEPSAGGINKLLLYGGIGVIVLLIAGFALFMILNKGKKKNQIGDYNSNDLDVDNNALNELFGEAEQRKVKPIKLVQDPKRDEIKEFANENPEIVAQVIKTLLRGEND
ncbi:MAG: flagellar M-ring protein FliF [Peptostreptococcaceae bacterium]|nr:flagellar M-ring protein FliF [Peptostreptococcaceae bacterium]